MTPNEKRWWRDQLAAIGGVFLVISAIYLYFESVF